MPSTETDQLIVNEMRRLDRAIAKRQKVIDSLSKKTGKQNFNRRYVLDLPVSLNAAGDGIDTSPVTRSFVVDRDCVFFRPLELSYTNSAVGTVASTPPVSGRFSFPNTAYLWFNYEVRDTYSDRSWQNMPLPDYAMGGGKLGGLPLGPTTLPAGTEVLFTLYPLNGVVGGDAFTASSFAVQVSFAGFEVVG